MHNDPLLFMRPLLVCCQGPVHQQFTGTPPFLSQALDLVDAQLKPIIIDKFVPPDSFCCLHVSAEAVPLILHGWDQVH